MSLGVVHEVLRDVWSGLVARLDGELEGACASAYLNVAHPGLKVTEAIWM